MINRIFLRCRSIGRGKNVSCAVILVALVAWASPWVADAQYAVVFDGRTYTATAAQRASAREQPVTIAEIAAGVGIQWAPAQPIDQLVSEARRDSARMGATINNLDVHRNPVDGAAARVTFSIDATFAGISTRVFQKVLFEPGGGIYIIGVSAPLDENLRSQMERAKGISYRRLVGELQKAQLQGQNSTVDQILSVFPMSRQAQVAFRERVRERRLSNDQAGHLIWQLMAEGETMLSRRETDEMGALYAKAVETLSPEEQMFIAQVNLKVGEGGGYDAQGQDRAQHLVQQGFSRLPARDQERFLQIRGRCIELALLHPVESQRQLQLSYPPRQPATSAMTQEQKRQRVQEITNKSVALLPEHERAHFLHLHRMPANQLTRAQYEERVRYSERIMRLLSDDDIRELQRLTAELIGQ